MLRTAMRERKKNMLPEKLHDVMSYEGVVSLTTWTSEGPHVTNTWNTYIVEKDDDRLLIGGQKLAPIGIFVAHALGDEYGIVVALPKDEGGENDIDNIKLNIEQ